ncbi:MAG: SusC/RagA family TonB-linked outer membrane protein [Ferruginibacter sp.]
MRKILLLMLFSGLCMLCMQTTMAQEKTITGLVTGSDNQPLSDVTVTVKGTRIVTKTNAAGMYSILASPGQTLVFSFVNFGSREVKVGVSDKVNASMTLQNQQMEEVVVVAMDIKRNPKELGYSVQKVEGKELQESQRENFVNGLQGRVAGLTVNQTGGAAGSSSQIVLRGFNSLALDNSPLFVVDGVIADNSTLNETSNGGSQLGLASDRPNRGNDYSNRISDLNPNDIESVTVLKGPEATALYGSQASSGAIIITTKRAKTNGRLAVSYDNSFRIQKLTRLPSVVNAYSSGTNLVPASTFSAFGRRYGGEQLYDNINHFFQTGFSQTHNLALEYGKKDVSFRFSGSLFDQQAAIPTNTYKRYNFRLSNTTKIGKYIDIMPSISYINTKNDKPLRGASGYLLNLLAWPSNDDIRDFQSPDGLKKILFNSNPNADLDNPFYNVYRNRSSDNTDRLLATFGIDINPVNWLTLAGRFGYDTYKTVGYTQYDSMSYFLNRSQKGQQDNYYRNYYGYNHTITATAKKTLGKFNGRLMVGNMWQDYEFQQWAVVGNNLKDYNNKDSNNTDPATRIRLSNSSKNLPNYSIRRSAAYFGEASVGWNSAVFLTVTHRFEESSIFPNDFRKYNFPAGSVSIIMSDIIPGIKGKVLNYWKLRGSLATTARSSSPYANQSVFNNALSSGGGFTYAFNNNNLYLRPEKQKTFEMGTEFRVINNRLSVDATYYNTRNSDLIVEGFRSSYATGFVLNTLNVGANKNEGVEVALNLDVVKGKGFQWNTRLNFNKMWNKVTALPANVPEFYQSDTWLYANARGGLVLGGPTTSITSYGYLRNKNGDQIISASTGLPIIDPNFRVRGDRNPDYTVGWANSMSYGNFRLSFLWDLKVGGDIFNGTERYLTTIGKSYRTIDRNEPRVINGVLQDGLENTATPTRNTISITPSNNQSYYTSMPEEEFIQKDVNWFRLRDISLNYTFGSGLTNRIKAIRSLGAFVTMNDLILITNYNGADPQVNGNTAGSRGVGGFGFDYGNTGTPISINLGIRASF